jgi:hypothetical protein
MERFLRLSDTLDNAVGRVNKGVTCVVNAARSVVVWVTVARVVARRLETFVMLVLD